MPDTARGRNRRLHELWIPITVLVLLWGPVLTLAVYLLGPSSLPFAEYNWVLLSFIVFGFVIIRYRMVFELNHYIRRYKAGEAKSVIDEFAVKYSAGDRSPKTLLVLSTACSYIGRGQEAEVYAHELMTAIGQRGDCGKKSLSAHRWCEYAMLAMTDSWTAQGRFSEAAHYLWEHISLTEHPDFQTAVVAYLYYLAGDDGNTRMALDDLKPMLGGVYGQRIPSPKYQFMLDYLAHKVLNIDSRSELQLLRSYLSDWEDEANRNAANPYGVRLQEILEDIHSLLTPEEE